MVCPEEGEKSETNSRRNSRKKESKAAVGREGEAMWRRLQRNHPVLYEVIQWLILAIAVLALIISIIKLL